MAPLKFTFLTDVHYYSPNLGVEGKAYELENSKNQKLLKNSGKAIASAFNAIAQDKTNEIVLINGDLTNNGEYESHREIIEMLRFLRQTGKRIFVTTATHDYQEGDGKAYRFEGDKKIETPSAKRDELFEMYREFGPDQALSVHRESMSYSAELDSEYLLLALNDDKNGKGQSGYSDELFDWIIRQIDYAKSHNQTVITMTHHPLIAPSAFYAVIGKNDMMGEHEKRLRQLSETGIGFVFTGHSHIHNISYKQFEDNIIFDISTSALAGFPGLYRVVTIDAQKNEMTIHSQKVEGFDDEFSDQFFGMIRRVINAAADDIDDFAQKAEAFSVKKKFTYRYGWMIKPLAKLIRKIRISTVCRLCRKESGLTKEEIKALKDSKVMDLVIDMAMNLYKGDGRFYPDTAEYKAAMGFAAVIDSFLETIKMPIGKFLKGIDSVCDVFEPLLYKKGIPDGDAVLPINADKTFAESLYPSAQRIKSKKGAGILIILILIVLILLPFVPLIAVLFGLCALANYIKFYKKIKELE